jgi:ABC-2 type transport system permease protein
MRAVDIAVKDLIQIARDWKSFLFLLLAPIVFTFFFGVIFGMMGGNEDPRLPVGLVLEDDSGAIGETLAELLDASEAIRPVLLEDTEAEGAADSVRDGELAAAVILPAGFSERASDLASEPASAILGLAPNVIVDQATVAGQTAVDAIQGALYRLLVSLRTARISAGLYDGLVGFDAEAEEEAYVDEGLSLAIAAWMDSPITVAVEYSGLQGDEEAGVAGSPYAHASAGMIVQFVVLGLSMPATVLVLERQCGALQRMFTAPISRSAVIGGHVLGMFVLVFAQSLVLILFGQLAFGAGYLQQPLATLLLTTVLALWAASLGLLISAISKNADQVTTLAMIAMFVFSALGGAWFPLDITGEAFAAIGHVMPTAWAIDGFVNIIVRGLGLSSVLVPAAVVLAYAVVFFVLAIWRFRYE